MNEAALFAAQSGPGAAGIMLQATVNSDLGIVSGQRNYSATIDGSATAVTVVSPYSYVGTLGDRVLITRAGSQMYHVAVLSPGNFWVFGNIFRLSPSSLDAANASAFTATTSVTAAVTLGAMPFTGYALVTGTADINVTASGASSIIGELFNSNTTVTEPAQIIRTMSVAGRWTVSQAWAVAVTQGDVLQLNIHASGAGGTATINAQHTTLAAIMV